MFDVVYSGWVIPRLAVMLCSAPTTRLVSSADSNEPVLAVIRKSSSGSKGERETCNVMRGACDIIGG